MHHAFVTLGTALISVAMCAVGQGQTQPQLPLPGQTLVISVRSSRQASPSAPYELRLESGRRLTVPVGDMHGAATEFIRSAMAKQARQVVKPSHLFVLRIQRTVAVSETLVLVTLLSGSTVHVAAADLRDPQLTFLRTALAEAAALERYVKPPEMSVEDRYVRSIIAAVRRNWQGSSISNSVTLKFLIQPDGRITDIEVEKSGGEASDQQAVRALTATGQVPPLPSGLGQGPLRVSMEFYMR